MAKYLRKCKGIGELAVKEVTQGVGVRTRARAMAMASAAASAAAAEGERVKRRRTTAAVAEIQVTYIQLRSRSVMMKPRPGRSAANPGGARRASSALARISRCSSNASCEAAPEDAAPRSSGAELDEELNPVAFSCKEIRDSDLESTVEKNSKRRSTAITPSEAEIDHFFAAHEHAERKRFASKYNYNIITDAPLKGRYEWVRLKP